MPSLKDIRRRIASVKKTGQITKAMKLVAAAKLKRASDAATSAKPYKNQLAAVLSRVAQKAGDSVSDPLLETREKVERVLVVVITSDRGLCGGFNNNLVRTTNEWLREKRGTGVEITLRCYGRKGAQGLPRRGWKVDHTVGDWSAKPKLELVRELVDEMVAGFVDRAYDEVWLVSNEWVSTLVQKPRFAKVLPLVVDAGTGTDAGLDYRYEPTAPEIVGALLPLYIRTIALQSFLETEAGEHASRMTAMDAATRNANDLISRLTLEYNRARQAAITKELIEIVSGAAAL
jgi:F-type H+-transporting ATPase subunit gamma